MGFGLGFSVMQSPAGAQTLGNPGRVCLGRGGQHGVVDRSGGRSHRHLQLMPSSSYPVRRELRVLTDAALID